MLISIRVPLKCNTYFLVYVFILDITVESNNKAQNGSKYSSTFGCSVLTLKMADFSFMVDSFFAGTAKVSIVPTEVPKAKSSNFKNHSTLAS